ncbi:unnamed protein product [Echinostoma caproni]|uniref:SH3 domain-containing protein n=1 Tax=Echinostoma caproni TaxID=27848 RepID=A0A183AHF5_9TREM|nr:unnamed protein product [Echinostoma caproni]
MNCEMRDGFDFGASAVSSQVRSLIDGNEGLVPLNFLRLHEYPKSNGQKSLRIPIYTRELDDSPAHSLPGKNERPVEYYEKFGSLSSNSTAGQNPVQLIPDPDKRSHSSSSATVPRASETKKNSQNTDGKLARISPLRGSFVRTLIEFGGSNPDELTFQSGSVIRVIGRAPVPPTSDRTQTDENGFRSSPDCAERLNAASISTTNVDDGWWEGELITPSTETPASNQTFKRVRGVFPSMLVQLMSQTDGEFWEQIWERAIPVPNNSISNASLDRNHLSDKSPRSKRPVKSTKQNSTTESRDDSSGPRTKSTENHAQSDEDYIQWSAHTVPKGRSSSRMDVPNQLNSNALHTSNAITTTASGAVYHKSQEEEEFYTILLCYAIVTYTHH